MSSRSVTTVDLRARSFACSVDLVRREPYGLTSIHRQTYSNRFIGIGDVRSRLVRLIPDTGVETQAIKRLFNHRLPKDYASARMEWLDLVEATHDLWKGVSLPKQELIRSFLNVINLEVVKRLRPSSRFDWSGASIGNLFLTG